jgi:hypothetical protein
VALLNGELTLGAITRGQNVRAWVERMTAPAVKATGRTADDHVVARDDADVSSVERAMDMSARSRPPLAVGSARRPRRPGELLGRARSSRQRLERAGGLSREDRAGQARLGGLRGTDVAYRLATPDLLAAAGTDADCRSTRTPRGFPLRGEAR